jgi:hypothetical protein
LLNTCGSNKKILWLVVNCKRNYVQEMDIGHPDRVFEFDAETLKMQWSKLEQQTAEVLT